MHVVSYLKQIIFLLMHMNLHGRIQYSIHLSHDFVLNNYFNPYLKHYLCLCFFFLGASLYNIESEIRYFNFILVPKNNLSGIIIYVRQCMRTYFLIAFARFERTSKRSHCLVQIYVNQIMFFKTFVMSVSFTKLHCNIFNIF